MKKFFVLLICFSLLSVIVNAQGNYQLSYSKNSASRFSSLERIVNYESKQYGASIIKKIMGLVGVYLKNGDSALKRGNYELAIKNYELAIKKLDGVSGAGYFIDQIEQRIIEIKKENSNSLKVKIRPLNNKASNYKSGRYPILGN